jgi:hypothetical protein
MTEKRLEGPYGTAEAVPVPDLPMAAETVCTWLLTAPHAHPAWSQYMLGVVRLRDVPGFPPPKREFDGATHELFVVALNPEHGPMTAERIGRLQVGGGVPYLTPVNIAHQIEGTDEEALHLAEMAATGVVHGVLPPETGDSPRRIRASWKTSLVKTLAHNRGEAHAP